MAQLTSILGVKDFFLLLLMVGFFSLLLTYHIGLNLPRPPEGHEEIRNEHPLKFHQNLFSSEDSFNQKHKDGNKQQHLSDATQKLSLLDQIFKLEERILSVSRLPALIQNKGGKDNSTGILEELLQHLDYSIVSQNGNELNIEKFSMIWNVKGNNSTQIIAKDLQKTNRILKLQKIILEPSFLCNVQRTQNAFSKGKVGDRTLCSVSPHLNKQTDLPFKSERDFVSLHKDGNITVQNQQIPQKNTETSSVLWAVSPGVLVVDGAPLLVRLSLLLTSLLPLRAYLHSSCQVYRVSQKGQSLRQDLISLWHLRQSIQQNFGETTMRGWWGQLRTGLMSALLTAELDVWQSRAGDPCSCRRCFQSLDLDVVFTNEFHPIIVKVGPSKLAQMTKEFMEDMVKLTSYKDPVYDEVMKAVGNIQPQKMHCKSQLSPCLMDSDLIYLLDTRREAMAPVEFLQLYPSINEEYDHLMDHFLHLHFTDHNSPTDATTQQTSCHITPEVHTMIAKTERIHQQVIKGEQLSLRTIQHKPMFMSRRLDAEFSEDSLVNKEESTLLSADKLQKNCSLVQEDLPLLSEISITPASIQLTPEFDPGRTMYRAQVEYDTIVFSITATTAHCDTTARFHTADGEERVMNYTLGLGENQIRVHVVTTAVPEPQIINTYIILIWRQERGITNFRPSLRVCQLTQDCELWYSSSSSCGLQAVRQFRSWRTYQKHNSQLPICQQSDYQEASWFVPCEDCKNPNSCHWKTAIWQPKFCQTKYLDDYDIRACFKGRKVLFIGDSTNRGIMHYILEKINGSLSEWDKTHNLKLYKSINGNQTDLSFSYYPQFWLPTNHRPAFDKAIFQLIKWTRPLSDDNRTVLVVGGVHWLAGQHLDLIIKALKRENLTHIKLIAKGLGSGFHQRVSGVHYLPESEIQNLVQRERDIERHGTQLGFQFISTFNMTMARFKDFLQGKCACHFHKLSEVKNDGYDKTMYHVQGEVNEIYSQMVINSICRS